MHGNFCQTKRKLKGIGGKPTLDLKSTWVKVALKTFTKRFLCEWSTGSDCSTQTPLIAVILGPPFALPSAKATVAVSLKTALRSSVAELAAAMVRTLLSDAGEKTKLEFLALEAITLPVRTKSASFCFFIAFCSSFFDREGLAIIFVTGRSAVSEDVLSFCVFIFELILERKEYPVANRRPIIFLVFYVFFCSERSYIYIEKVELGFWESSTSTFLPR